MANTTKQLARDTAKQVVRETAKHVPSPLQSARKHDWSLYQEVCKGVDDVHIGRTFNAFTQCFTMHSTILLSRTASEAPTVLATLSVRQRNDVNDANNSIS